MSQVAQDVDELCRIQYSSLVFSVDDTLAIKKGDQQHFAHSSGACDLDRSLFPFGKPGTGLGLELWIIAVHPHLISGHNVLQEVQFTAQFSQHVAADADSLLDLVFLEQVWHKLGCFPDQF